MPSFRLTALRGHAPPLPIGGGKVTIGRHPDNTLPIVDEKASRFHCEIVPDGAGGLVVRDLGSRNGTRVNEQKVTQSPLFAGDVIGVGGHEFLVEQASEQSGTALPSLSRTTADPESVTAPRESPRSTSAEPVGSERSGAAEGDAAVSQPASSPAWATAASGRELAAWAQDLASTIEQIPPKLAAPETVGLVDSGGRNNEALSGASDGPAAVRLLLRCASKARATDIHVEPKGELFHVRMRVDGQMVPIADLPTRVGELSYGLIKTACQMGMAARDAVQEGHFSARFPDRRVDYRVSFTPSVHGQKLVLRVLDSRSVPSTLHEIGLAGYMLDRVRRVCHQDHGLLLVCGPTGSGKTTTLYNAIREIDRYARNVVTIEDPVEYQLDGVTQIPIDAGKGNTFGQLLRSVLRQDPDVILVGEIRDEETARTAMQAAMTGHVVFSTVHAKDTIAATFRLLDLKVEPYLVANSLDLVLAQRLVRVLCEFCRREIPVGPGQASRLGRHLQGKTRMFAATGCSRCLRTGYRGRRAIFELLDFNDELRDVVLREPTIAAMKKTIEQGMFTTLAQSGWRLVADGATTLDEVDRVAGMG